MINPKAKREAESLALDKNHNPDQPLAFAKCDTDLVWIPKDKLRAHPLNPRISRRREKLEAIQLTIEREGFPQRYALVVRKIRENGEDVYEIIDGHGRFEIADGLDAVTMIPCLIVTMSDREAAEWIVRGNIHDEMSKLEMAVGSLAVIPDERVPGAMSIAEYGKMIGWKGPNLSRYRNGARVYVHVRDHGNLSDEFIRKSANKAEHLAIIYKAEKEHWTQLVRECVTDNWTMNQCTLAVQALKDPGAASPDGNADPDQPGAGDGESDGTLNTSNGAQSGSVHSAPKAIGVGDLIDMVWVLPMPDQARVAEETFHRLDTPSQHALLARLIAATGYMLTAPALEAANASPVGTDPTEQVQTEPEVTRSNSDEPHAPEPIATDPTEELRERAIYAFNANPNLPKDLVKAGIYSETRHVRRFISGDRGIDPKVAKNLSDYLDKATA